MTGKGSKKLGCERHRPDLPSQNVARRTGTEIPVTGSSHDAEVCRQIVELDGKWWCGLARGSLYFQVASVLEGHHGLRGEFFSPASAEDVGGFGQGEVAYECFDETVSEDSVLYSSSEPFTAEVG